jgi:hypothetical protein
VTHQNSLCSDMSHIIIAFLVTCRNNIFSHPSHVVVAFWVTRQNSFFSDPPYVTIVFSVTHQSSLFSDPSHIIVAFSVTHYNSFLVTCHHGLFGILRLFQKMCANGAAYLGDLYSLMQIHQCRNLVTKCTKMMYKHCYTMYMTCIEELRRLKKLSILKKW